MDGERELPKARSRAVRPEVPLSAEVLQGCLRWRERDILVLAGFCEHAVNSYGHRRRLHDPVRRDDLARDITMDIVIHLLGHGDETPEGVLALIDRRANRRTRRAERIAAKQEPQSKESWLLIEGERGQSAELPDSFREAAPVFSVGGDSAERFWSVLLDVFRESLNRLRQRHHRYADMVAEKHFTPKGARAERIPCSAQSVRRARRALRETMAAVCRDVLAGSTDEATRRAYENYLAFLESSAVKGRTTFTELVEFLRRRFREKGTSQSE